MRWRTRSRAASFVLGLTLVAGCSDQGSDASGFTPTTRATHSAFPIVSGWHAVDCNACHGTSSSFKQFDCLGCHARAPTAAVHPGVGAYLHDSAACYRCHQDPSAQAFDHAVSGTCASCHAAGAGFPRLPLSQATHPDTRGLDCASCHSIAGWADLSAPAGPLSDPGRIVSVPALLPRFSGTSITSLTPETERLPMPMDHASAEAVATGLRCADCHPTAAGGSYYPGRFHDTLANRGLPPPATCADCHATSAPTGFVGPLATSPPRDPPSGEMRHEAVAWSGSVPTSSRIVTQDCSVCHASPSASLQASWATGRGGTTPARFHASLTASAAPQPVSCLECHANGRPGGVLASPGAALGAGIQFDHGASDALGDCAGCHAAVSSWEGGRHHRAGDSNPESCLPCHEGERPVSTDGWADPAWAASPFDYVTNVIGVPHGDGQDCAVCHAGPGIGGSWGVAQGWTGGHFTHGAGTVAVTTCAACHQSQRPDRLLGQAAAAAALGGYDHAVDGTGDCIGCHQATVASGRYVRLYSAGGTLPGGDWAGGASYPGATPVGSPGQGVTVATLALVRATPGGLVTGTTRGEAMLPNQMLHVSPAVPAAISPGPASAPDPASCWHCHTHDAQGTVTSFGGGVFHAALDRFSATVGGPVTPLAQPAAHCADCHGATRPPAVVVGSGGALAAMDHAAPLAPGSAIGGGAVASVGELDCSLCHHQTVAWSGGAFHAPIGAAVPADCVACHVPLMLDAAAADVTSAPGYHMAHRSAQLASQACAACHLSALTEAQSLAAGTAPSASMWRPGALHAGVPSQPSACIDCHAVSQPATGVPTQSTVRYVLSAGQTSTNAGQWMNHGAAPLATMDCAACHAADAGAAVTTWSRSTAFHANVVSPGACGICHGLQNGNGAASGTGNNLPAGLTSSSTLTSAADDPTTGVPAGTHDEITHDDVNVASHDCAFCHTQVGPSSAPGIQGAEWAQGTFHASFSAATPLVLNGTTGRCSNCHMNVAPGATYAPMDHTPLGGAPGTQDCSACHAWPGTGTPAAPNWRGASGMPAFIAVGGFDVPRPPADAATTQPGIADLPHPTLESWMDCATCHAGGVGGRGAIGYDHASPLAATNCGACHEAGSGLLGTPWNGATAQASGAGDTRPYTLPSIVVPPPANGTPCTIAVPNHFYPVDCSECHATPPWVGAVTTGADYLAAWRFVHAGPSMRNPSTCNLCHVGQDCGM